MTKHWTDRELWESLTVTPDRVTAPGYRFGKYVHPTMTRAQLRASKEGRMLLNKHAQPDGRSHEKGSDVSPFVAWDGEGITYEQGKPQQYVLFGSSTGHYAQGESLDTATCLNVILDCERQYPDSIHVGFAFKYDAEMILRDLTFKHWIILRQQSSVRWQQYRITYHPGRIFRVSVRENGRTVTATIYDVWGFFQGSFINALKGWLDEDELAEIEKIETGKQARGQFKYAELDSFIKPYWQSELRLLVVLCNRLRERLVATELCPSEWHGAGALATRIYRKHGTRQHISRSSVDWTATDKDITTVLPEEVNHAARFAYAGGRFELFRLGHHEGKVYQYDINSAYPNAISKLPSLRGSEWEYRVSPTFNPRLFAMWHVEYARRDTYSLFEPGPLHHRDSKGKVTFPGRTEGWYWTPEVALIANHPDAVITEAWICHHEDDYPFTWVVDMYNERRQRKANGDPSEKAYKLGLNSLYGKMAQRLGWKPGESLPRFHQLEWAGWVTSYTRMMLYSGITKAGSGLIAVETDAVFSTKPLDLDCGSGLGQWEVTEHDWITYLQSGTYWSNHGAKYRGFDRDSISHDDAMRWLRRADFSVPLIGTTTRFIGAGTGLGSPLHRCWVTDSRDLSPGRVGKRVHIAESCHACQTGRSPAESLHVMVCISRGGHSHPHALPWRDDDAPGLEWQESWEISKYDSTYN